MVQLYLTDEKASTPRPIRQLLSLKPGESKVVEFSLDPRQLSVISDKELRVIEPGWFNVAVGGKQPGFSGNADAHTTDVVTGRFRVTGKEYWFAVK